MYLGETSATLTDELELEFASEFYKRVKMFPQNENGSINSMSVKVYLLREELRAN